MSDLYAPYRPPVVGQRGYRVGPTIVPMDLAQSDAACLAADLRVDQSVAMNLATGSGACLDATCDITIPVSVYLDMLPAVSDGDCLAADASLSYNNDMLVASGSGVALAPTLSVFSPPQYNSSGGNDRGSTSATSITLSWTHTVPAGPNTMILLYFYQLTDGTALAPTVTFNGATMTQVDQVSPSGAFMRCYQIASPGAGTYTANVTLARSGGTVMYYFGNSFCYTNCSSIVSSGVDNRTASGTISLTTTAVAASEKAVGVFAGESVGSTIVSGTNVTSRYTNHQNTIGLALGDAPGAAATQVFNTNNSAATAWGGIWVRLAGV